MAGARRSRREQPPSPSQRGLVPGFKAAEHSASPVRSTDLHTHAQTRSHTHALQHGAESSPSGSSHHGGHLRDSFTR